MSIPVNQIAKVFGLQIIDSGLTISQDSPTQQFSIYTYDANTLVFWQAIQGIQLDLMLRRLILSGDLRSLGGAVFTLPINSGTLGLVNQTDLSIPYYDAATQTFRDSGLGFGDLDPAVEDKIIGSAAYLDVGIVEGCIPQLGQDGRIVASTSPRQGLFDYFATVGNGTTVETDLISSTIASGQLVNNGDKVIGQYGGTLANNANTKRLRAYFAGTLIFDSLAAATGAAGFWNLEIMVIRVSLSVVRCVSVLTSFNWTGPVTVGYVQVSSLKLENSNILKITGTSSAASSDITAELGAIWYERF